MELTISVFKLPLVCMNLPKKFFIHFTSEKIVVHFQFHSDSFISPRRITGLTLLGQVITLNQGNKFTYNKSAKFEVPHPKFGAQMDLLGETHFLLPSDYPDFRNI